jgi:hypothetical protein
MSDLDPTVIPIDTYESYTSFDTERRQLDEITRQNERPIEQHSHRFKKGELTALVGNLLLAVPGVPLPPSVMAACIFPAEFRELEGQDDAEPQRQRLERRMRSTVGTMLVARYLQPHGYRHQVGMERNNGSLYQTYAYHRAIPLDGAVEIGERQIRGRVISWREPYYLAT